MVEPNEDQALEPDDGFHQADAYRAIDRAVAEGWNDPPMDDYDRYDEMQGRGATDPVN